MKKILLALGFGLICSSTFAQFTAIPPTVESKDKTVICFQPGIAGCVVYPNSVLYYNTPNNTGQSVSFEEYITLNTGKQNPIIIDRMYMFSPDGSIKYILITYR